jgi:hypothetical protein
MTVGRQSEDWLTDRSGGRTSKNKQTRRLPLNTEAVSVLTDWRQSAASTTNVYVFQEEVTHR